jgi:signal transduction histidine kinase
MRLHELRTESLGLRLICECEDVSAAVDPMAMQQALSNLLDNALKFAPKGSDVRVQLKQTDAAWRWTVRDAGPGVPADERERVFEAFHRVGSELTRETTGVGIGLSIVKHIVEAHRGRVWIEPNEPAGACVCIELPLS